MEQTEASKNQQNETAVEEAQVQAEAAEKSTEEAGADSSASDSPEQKIAELEQKLAEAESKAKEYQDNLMYAKAEADNIRRRSAEEVTKAQKFAVEKFSAEILAVKDSLDAALDVEVATVENYKNGMELTQKQLLSIFEKFSITEVNPVGEKLDPHKHQAISMVDSEQPANTVVNVMQKGYMLHERVLRPAMVTVAK